LKARRWTRIDWARLNYILLPDGRVEQEPRPRGAGVRALGALYGIYDALTEEGRVACLVTLLVAFGAVDIRQSDVYVLFSVLVSLIYASLVVSRLTKLDGVTLTVETPRRVTVGEPITFTLRCKNAGDRDRHGLRIRGKFDRGGPAI